MTIHFRITESLLRDVHRDLSRRHPFALERVAFMSARPAALADGSLLLLAHALHPVTDENYESSEAYGAVINGAAFRDALQFAFNNKVSMFHVHRHEHRGLPRFSDVDLTECAAFVPNFWNVRPTYPHGALVLSIDSVYGLVWSKGREQPVPISRFTVAGNPLVEVHHDGA